MKAWRRLRHEHLDQDLVFRQRRLVKVLKEVGQRNFAPTVWPDNGDPGTKAHQDCGRIRGVVSLRQIAADRRGIANPNVGHLAKCLR